MVVTSVAFEEELHRRLRLASVESRIPLTAIIRTAARTWLDAWERRRRAKQ